MKSLQGTKSGPTKSDPAGWWWLCRTQICWPIGVSCMEPSRLKISLVVGVSCEGASPETETPMGRSVGPSCRRQRRCLVKRRVPRCCCIGGRSFTLLVRCLDTGTADGARPAKKTSHLIDRSSLPARDFERERMSNYVLYVNIDRRFFPFLRLLYTGT